MKPQDSTDLKWVGVDLHVHTPASRDYRGNREAGEYSRLIRAANEFGSSDAPKKKHSERAKSQNPIGCVVFTDHNSVDGFCTFRRLLEENESLSKAIRARDPDNPLAIQNEKEIDVLRSVRVLM